MTFLKHPLIASALLSFLLLGFSGYTVANINDQLDNGIDLHDDHRFENASSVLQLVVRSRQFRRLDYTEKYLALSHLISSYVEQDKLRDAMMHTKTLLEVSENGSGQTSEDYLEALRILAVVQYRSDKQRNAVRTVLEMESLLERMGNDYRKALARTRKMLRAFRQKTWDKEKRRDDLSDFYTQCESIEPDSALANVAKIMGDYSHVGTDYKPKRNEKRRFETTYIKEVRERASDRAKRLIYIPDEKHLHDWCVVYPDGARVDRAVTVPPRN